MLIGLTLVAVAVTVFFAYLSLRRTGSPPLEGDAGVIEQLRRAGSDLQRPHKIEFFLYFPTQQAAQHIATKLVPLGLESVVQPAAEGSTRPWLLFATRSMIPQLEELVRMRSILSALAATENGEYDGWGTPIVPA